MEYMRIYDQLIEKRRREPLSRADGYVERHHIVPRSEGGSDDETNLVNLTAREHYVAHLLLAKIYDDHKMWNAIWRMTTGWIGKNCHMFSSRTYARIRENFVKVKTGTHHSIEARRKMSLSKKGMTAWNKGKHWSAEARRNMSTSHRGKTRQPLSEETKRKISISHTGKHLSEETRRKMSLAKKGRTTWNKGKQMPEEFRRKMSKLNLGNQAHKGKHHSEETKRRLAEATRLWWAKKRSGTL